MMETFVQLKSVAKTGAHSLSATRNEVLNRLA
jgi:hypothetical protein